MLAAEKLTNREIESRSTSLIDELVAKVGHSYLVEHGLHFEELFEKVIAPRYGITIKEGICLGTQRDGTGLLGLYDIQTRVAYIDFALRSDAADPRRVFTLYHEVVGHGVLQGEWLRSQIHGPYVLEETEDTINPGTRETLERQANAMAGFTAAPLWLVKKQIVRRLAPTHQIVFTKPAWFHIGDRFGVRRFHADSYLSLCAAVATVIHPWFGGLSVEALSYRVRRCNQLVVDKSPNGRCDDRPGMRLKRMHGSPWLLSRAAAV